MGNLEKYENDVKLIRDVIGRKKYATIVTKSVKVNSCLFKAFKYGNRN